MTAYMLTQEQIARYHADGLLFIPAVFTRDEIEPVRDELPVLFAEQSPRRILEKDSKLVRTVFAPHTTREVFARLARHARIVEPAQDLLGGDVYIHQYKINVKASRGGDVWKWHQDYLFWLKEDGMPKPRVLSAAVFLDDVTEENGPLQLIPRSHKLGVIDVAPRGSGWMPTLTADLKYALDDSVMEEIANRDGVVVPTGPAGSVLYFDGNTLHASAENCSDHDRVIAFITYNSVENALHPVQDPRPEWIADRRFEPVHALAADDALVPQVAAR